jgi:hypothetical protein
MASVLLMALFVSSCATLAKPESPPDSFVIGSLVLDFPDGFFTEAPRTIDSGVTVEITNKTRGTRFALLTSAGGYFSFVGNGGNQYSIESYRFSGKTKTEVLPLEGKISYLFTATSHTVDYVGHFTVRYGKPRQLEDKSADAKSGHLWQFEIAQGYDTRPAAVRESLANTAWASFPLQTLSPPIVSRPKDFFQLVRS